MSLVTKVEKLKGDRYKKKKKLISPQREVPSVSVFTCVCLFIPIP